MGTNQPKPDPRDIETARRIADDRRWLSNSELIVAIESALSTARREGEEEHQRALQLNADVYLAREQNYKAEAAVLREALVRMIDAILNPDRMSGVLLEKSEEALSSTTAGASFLKRLEDAENFEDEIDLIWDQEAGAFTAKYKGHLSAGTTRAEACRAVLEARSLKAEVQRDLALKRLEDAERKRDELSNAVHDLACQKLNQTNPRLAAAKEPK